MLTRLSLRKSLPLVLGLFGLAFTLLLTAWHLPWRADEALHSWRNHTQQHLALLQSSLSDHRRYGRIAEMETELADLASLEGVRWAMVVDQQLRVIATTRLGQSPEELVAVDAGELAERIADGRSSWIGTDGSEQLAVYPLDRVAVDGRPLREALLVDFDVRPILWQTERDAWLYLAQTLTLLIMLGLLLQALYQWLITNRLARIDRAARAFTLDQQPQPPAVTGSDEIGHLAATFSRMMLQLHNRQNDLRQSEQLMRELIDNAPIGMLVVDDQLRVQQANPAAARLFGCPPEDLLGQRPEDRLFDADASERLLRLPANTPLQMTGRRGDAQIPLEITCTPFERHGARLNLVLLRDIGLLQAPATKVAGVLQAPAGQLARVFNAYATKDAA